MSAAKGAGVSACGAALGALLAGLAGAQDPPTAAGSAPPSVAFGEIRGAAAIVPDAAALGERLTYRVTVRGTSPFKVRFLPPDAGGAFTWGRLSARRSTHPNEPAVGPGAWVDGTHEVVAEVPLQVFALGDVTVPGLLMDVDDGRGPRRLRVPTAQVAMAPVLAASDTAADLRPVRGPIAAPWWERVPWTLVVIGVLALALAWFLWWRWRSRKRRPAPAAAPVPVRVADPLTTALNELAALRRLNLPARGEYGEHAFRLTRIVRRFVETVAGSAHPGDSTPELVEHLAASALGAGEVQRLEGLLRMWDRIKFARVPTSREEAERAERSVEEFLRLARPPAPTAAPPAGGKAA